MNFIEFQTNIGRKLINIDNIDFISEETDWDNGKIMQAWFGPKMLELHISKEEFLKIIHSSQFRNKLNNTINEN